MHKVHLRAVVMSLAMFLVHATVLFASAGRTNLPWFWAMLGVWMASLFVNMLAIPADLLRERMKPGPGVKERWFRPALLILYLCLFAVAGLDAGRFEILPAVPIPLRVVGLVGFAGLIAVAIWAQRTNPFFSSAVRIQTDRGQHVISDGPYRFIRHPGYAAFLWGPVLVGLALGSWLATLLFPACAALFVTRTVIEDRTLRAELPGYEEYVKRVRWRLVPGIW